MKMPVENFQFLGKTVNMWHEYLYHSISVKTGIRKTASERTNKQTNKHTNKQTWRKTTALQNNFLATS